MFEQIRPPAVAGFFYPAEQTELENMLQGFLQVSVDSDLQIPPKAIIVPHAGYIYSGSVAASAYVRLQPVQEKIRRVVLLGPSHHVPFRGLATSSATYFATPLGEVKLDTDSTEKVLQLPQVGMLDAAHEQEHSLEVHLPFLQMLLDDFVLLPLVVGDANAAAVAQVLEQVWGGEETLIVISSDLSHFHDYQTAQQLDAQTSKAITSLEQTPLRGEQACGCKPVNGLLKVARDKHLSVDVVDLRNSGDTAGSKDRVVGYGAYVFH
ncbi:AmmeMemoRadiSam system protein B [Candidatus Venteria ishoeyi]|uniref:MEMO1 family protein MBHS_02430 n=1 Tax=Candidatus Venteria ishoeyi TaxID=1899563 RepID=A0A1H6F8W1_9GAMM|nr:AmmeMemoRadiSam system protein B [Candidatus Venteria ishoeyi]MDM8547005.1 AmmeMemoRadiSam system protein B [Candidatus Venteria ishoeyi]SEH06567.1 Uncharacterised protein [Candidatus Venteria ishoeyi]